MSNCTERTGMLTHRIFRGLSSGALNCLHTTLTVLSLIFFVIGIYAVFTSLNALGCVHLYSVHSWVGLMAILLSILQWTSGLTVFLFPRFVYEVQILFVPFHHFFGRLVFTVICGTAIIGISDKLRITGADLEGLGPIHQTNQSTDILTVIKRETNEYWQLPKEALLANIIAIAFLFYAIYVNYLSSNESYKRRLPLEEQGIEVKTQIKNKLLF
jgi:cytochrome b-561